MTSYVEVLGDRPGRPADGKPDVPDPHPQPADGRRTGGEQVDDTITALRTRGRGEEGQRAEMHRVPGRFEVPERQIEGARSSLLKGDLLS